MDLETKICYIDIKYKNLICGCLQSALALILTDLYVSPNLSVYYQQRSLENCVSVTKKRLHLVGFIYP